MNRMIAVGTLMALAALAPVAQAAEFNAVQVDRSSLAFQYKQMGVAMDGRFGRFSAQMSFDPAKPASAKASLDVDLSSLDAGSREANDEVAGKDWFHTRAFPRASFVSSSVKALGGNRYQVTGKMTIKGRSQEVSAPFTFTPQGNAAAFDGAFVLKRAGFAIGEGAWSDFGAVANEIQIKFHFLATARK